MFKAALKHYPVKMKEGWGRMLNRLWKRMGLLCGTLHAIKQPAIYKVLQIRGLVSGHFGHFCPLEVLHSGSKTILFFLMKLVTIEVGNHVNRYRSILTAASGSQ